jgi:hypothetical protein
MAWVRGHYARSPRTRGYNRSSGMRTGTIVLIVLERVSKSARAIR